MLYYVNTNEQLDESHVVHCQNCLWLPDSKKRIFIGNFENCKDAVKTAKKYFSNVDGCFFCCKEAHNN